MPKYDLSFSPPLMNAAGCLGFAPDPGGPVDLARLGAFVTNSISRRARTPAHGARWLPFPGGFLLHSGYPNPGFSRAVKRYSPAWARAPLPVLAHLLGEDPGEIAGMAARLETVEGVSGIELGIPPQAEARAALELVAAAAGELPLVVRLPLERAGELAPALARAATPIAAFSLGPPRGALPAGQEAPVHGRLYGPAIFPLALQAVESLAGLGLPVIGAGGVYNPEQVEAMLRAGAIAVQLDTVLWGRGGMEEWKIGRVEDRD